MKADAGAVRAEIDAACAARAPGIDVAGKTHSLKALRAGAHRARAVRAHFF